MSKRFVAIWFRYLVSDRMIRSRPDLKGSPFVTALPQRGRMVVVSASNEAQRQGIHPGMVVADCKAILPALQVFDTQKGLEQKLLTALAEWCIRFTPFASVDMPDGLILDATGCTHLWGGEENYVKDIAARLGAFGYDVRVAMADTVGAARGIARYGTGIISVVKSGGQLEALMPLPPDALHLEETVLQRLRKLGLTSISKFIHMPKPVLRRRFGRELLSQLGKALGQEIEIVYPVIPLEPYRELLPSLEPIRTATGIEIALKQLLEQLCKRLENENKGLRRCVFKCYRIDNNIQQIEIGTNRPSRSVKHLFKLFENKIANITPALGIELFILEAPVVEELQAGQEAMWHTTEQDEQSVAELLDRIAGKVGSDKIHRYLPDEHYWPERSYKQATSLAEKPATEWRTDLPRPILLLPCPELIEVMVRMPDYPPLHFIYQGKRHMVNKADGPERIEQEWWLQKGLYRDYYCIEDEEGARFWLFRAGPYDEHDPKWYIHGFFA